MVVKINSKVNEIILWLIINPSDMQVCANFQGDKIKQF